MNEDKEFLERLDRDRQLSAGQQYLEQIKGLGDKPAGQVSIDVSIRHGYQDKEFTAPSNYNLSNPIDKSAFEGIRVSLEEGLERQDLRLIEEANKALETKAKEQLKERELEGVIKSE